MSKNKPIIKNKSTKRFSAGDDKKHFETKISRTRTSVPDGRKKFKNKFSPKKYNSANRLDFIHNLNSILIILIVLLHSVAAYTLNFSKEFRWDIEGDNIIELFDILAITLDNFVMPILMFIGGYLALGPLLKYGNSRYFTFKFINLFLPALFGYFILNSFPNYLYHVSHEKFSGNFFSYFVQVYIPGFHHMLLNNHVTIHLWFLMLLFTLCSLLVLVNLVNKEFLRENYKSASISYPLLLVFALVTSILCLLISANYAEFGHWKKWLFAITSDPTELPIFIMYFILGIVAYKKKWLQHLKGANQILRATLSIIGIIIEVMAHYEFNFLHLKKLSFEYYLVHNITSIYVLLFLMSLFHTKLNFAKNWLRSLSKNSLIIYVIHFNFVIAMQYILLDVYMPIILKLILVFSVSLIASYLCSEYIVRRLLSRFKYLSS